MNEIIGPEIAVEWTLDCFVIKNLNFVLSHCSLCPEADLSTFNSVLGGHRHAHHVASSAHRLLTAA
jgi:hypothetical protein